MDYILLAGAIVLFSLQFVFSKKYQIKAGEGLIQSVWFSLLMFSFMFLFFFTIKGFTFSMPLNVMIYPLIYAIMCIACNIGIINAMNYGKMSIVTVYLTLGGAMFPFTYGILFLHEQLTIAKIVAVVLMILSFLPNTVFKNKKEAKVKSNTKFLFAFYCFLCFAANGIANLLMKLYQDKATMSSATDFIVFGAWISAFLAGIICLVYILIKRKKEHLKLNRIIDRKLLSKVCIMSALIYCLFNGTATLMNMSAAKTLEASFQFPAVNVGAALLTCLWGFVFNKEKLTRYDAASVSLAAVSIVLIAF